MIDSHAHLYFDRFDPDRPEVIDRARQAGVDRIINIGTDVDTSRAAIALCTEGSGLYATVGLHPTSRIPDLEAAVAALRDLALANAGRVVAIGEIGLDYHWKDVPPAEQAPRFRLQLALARDLGLPVVFHVRESIDDVLRILESEPSRTRGVFHCFSGGLEHLRRVLDLGYHVSFAGNVTYPKAAELQAVARAAPLDRLLLETDCPFLAPQPERGRRNEPAFVRHTRDFLARLLGVPPADLESATIANTEDLFRLEPAFRQARAGVSCSPTPAPGQSAAAGCTMQQSDSVEADP